MNILIKGLSEFENGIINGAVGLFESRKPKLSLIGDDDIDSAEVIIIDAKDANSLSWASKHHNWLEGKTVIWVDGHAQNPEHADIKRPIMWVNLPIILSRILDDISVKRLNHSHVTTENKDNIGSSKKKILIVDDSIAIRNHMTSILSNEGFSTETVENGELALEITNEQKFDSILMDVLMPGIDGYKACRQIKGSSKNGNTPVIMLTGRGSMFDRVKGKMAGCSKYLTKPVDIRELRETLQEYA